RRPRPGSGAVPRPAVRAASSTGPPGRMPCGPCPCCSASSGTWPGRTSPSRCRRCRSEEHTSEFQSLAYLVCRLLLEKKNGILRPYLPKHGTNEIYFQAGRILTLNYGSLAMDIALSSVLIVPRV